MLYPVQGPDLRPDANVDIYVQGMSRHGAHTDLPLILLTVLLPILETSQATLSLTAVVCWAVSRSGSASEVSILI